jgi:hypothetical protein
MGLYRDGGPLRRALRDCLLLADTAAVLLIGGSHGVEQAGDQ